MPKYTVLAEGWLTNARGHGAHYAPAAEGEEPVTIEMSEGQAEYLISSGQIASREGGDAQNAPKSEALPGPSGTTLDPAGAVSAEPQAGAAGANIAPDDAGAVVIGTDGSDAGRSASRRKA